MRPGSSTRTPLGWLFVLPLFVVQDDEAKVIERSFSSELDLHTDSCEISSTSGGKTEQREGPGFQRRETGLVEVADTLEDAADPSRKFTREYRTAGTLHVLGSDGRREQTESSPWEKKHVTFERDDEGHYQRTSDDADVRPHQLERLRAELSLACFLPGEDDAESWEIPYEACARLAAPLGDTWTRTRRKKLPSVEQGLNLAPVTSTDPIALFLQGAEGVVTATLSEAPEEAELPRLARLAFRFENMFDASERMPLGSEAEVENEIEVTYEGEGELAWDPEDGRIRIELSGELTLRETFTVRLEQQDTEIEVRGKLECSGTLGFEANEF